MHAMEKVVRVLAPAKVNLHLRVYGRRSDGYHGIRSIFQAVSLADSIVVRSLKQPQRIEIDGVFDCPPEKTTLYKAIVVFREMTGVYEGVEVSVQKAIPAGGGLGGGSSDAASLLVALDNLFETKLAHEVLEKAAGSIGSDVPFFLKGGSALVSGRGEIVKPLPERLDYSFAVVFPGFPMNTKSAYEVLDTERPDDSGERDFSESELSGFYQKRPRNWPFLNSFEPFVQGLHPEIGIWHRRLLDEGADFVQMSGSGSTVFGVFSEKDGASAAVERLKEGLGTDLLVATAFPLACGISLL
jgi:4-diphosphocytidyl-2-C-methyl-D-erythritol kinase